MRSDKVNAVVLHSRAWRETSQILDVFTADFGRVSLVSRGSRAGKQGRTSLAPFQLYQLSWTGRGELKTLTGYDCQIQWHLTAERSLCGLYLNELLIRLLPLEDAHPRLFASYLSACDNLDRAIDDPALALRRFEISLLTEMGFAIDLACDASGEQLDPQWRYDYEAGQGWVTAPERSDEALLGSSLLALEQGSLAMQADESRRLRLQLRRLVDEMLGNRPLHTRELLLQYRLKKG